MTIKLEPNARSMAAHVIERVRRESAFAAAKHATRGTDHLDEAVRAHLLVAAYQLLFLERVPAFAAVSEGVRQIQLARGKRVGAFANAILRRLARETAGDKREALEAAIRASVSPALLDALVHSLGADGAEAFLVARGTPPVGLRIRWGEDPGRSSPLAIEMHGGSDPQKLPFYRDGRITIHEEGAHAIALSLGACSGETTLDACAGRGNKTSLIAEMVSPSGAVDAADQHPQKLVRLSSELARLHLAARATYAVDWTIGPGDVPGGYDRVLVDAPCSGTGTIRRRPDLATRWQASSLSAFQALQVAMLVAASERAREGGAILYAVCSVLREEGEDVVERAVARAPWLSRAPFPAEPARSLAGEATTLRLTPHEHGTDGYFMASLVRSARS